MSLAVGTSFSDGYRFVLCLFLINFLYVKHFGQQVLFLNVLYKWMFIWFEVNIQNINTNIILYVYINTNINTQHRYYTLVNKRHTQNWDRRSDLKDAFAASVKLHTEANVTGLSRAGELTQQSRQDGAGQCLLAGQIMACTAINITFHQGTRQKETCLTHFFCYLNYLF